MSPSGEVGEELGPPPSVDEAANTLMTRLGFLLGDKMSEGPPELHYSMEEAEDTQVRHFMSLHVTSRHFERHCRYLSKKP